MRKDALKASYDHLKKGTRSKFVVDRAISILGILGARGVLPDSELEEVISRFKTAGGLVSSRKNRSGEETCYELNATWWCVLNLDSEEDLDTQIRRYLVARSIGLCLRGVPGVYLNGLVGALNDVATVMKTGNNRDVNSN